LLRQSSAEAAAGLGALRGAIQATPIPDKADEVIAAVSATALTGVAVAVIDVGQFTALARSHPETGRGALASREFCAGTHKRASGGCDRQHARATRLKQTAACVNRVRTSRNGDSFMKRYQIWTGALLLASLGAANVVAAQSADAPIDTTKSLLQRMDRDMDGKISFEEYRNAMLRRFEASDQDSNGVLEGSEYPSQWLSGATAGKVSWSDFAASLQSVFDRFDGDHDGQLDAAEIAALAAARKSRQESKS
jgi:hypothetical protein